MRRFAKSRIQKRVEYKNESEYASIKIYGSQAISELSKTSLPRDMPYNYLKHKLLTSHWIH